MSNKRFKKKRKGFQTQKLSLTTVELSNGKKITVGHNFKNIEGPVNSFKAAFDNWLARTEVYTPESFIQYVKYKEPERICITEEQFNKATKNLKADSIKKL